MLKIPVYSILGSWNMRDDVSLLMQYIILAHVCISFPKTILPFLQRGNPRVFQKPYSSFLQHGIHESSFGLSKLESTILHTFVISIWVHRLCFHSGQRIFFCVFLSQVVEWYAKGKTIHAQGWVLSFPLGTCVK